MPNQTLNNLIEKIVEKFEDKFTFEGDFGERIFSHIIVTNRTKNDPIVPREDDLTVALKSFLRQELTYACKEYAKSVVREKIENVRKKEDPYNSRGDVSWGEVSRILDEILSAITND